MQDTTASIAERLYVNQQNKEDMCGLLIYTAAGDEGHTWRAIKACRSRNI